MARSKRTGQVRIIGGDWRGRRLAVLDRPGLRPTGDRARETLFNWLQGRVAGRRVADLFAGSGALGFEAASRGAARVDLVESDRRAADALKHAVDGWPGAERVRVHTADALDWLARLDAPGDSPGDASDDASDTMALDLVFVDPPFDAGLYAAALLALAVPGRLAEDGRVYVESDRRAPDPLDGAAGWSLLREKVQGDVRMQLARLHRDEAPRPV